MKIALVHDFLNQWGGAERVLSVLCELFPAAPIYTLLYDATSLGNRLQNKRIYTSILDYPFVRKRHHWLIPAMPIGMQMLKLQEKYDVIISDSAGYAKGIVAPLGTNHICYCHTPLRYAWEKETIVSRLMSVGLPRAVARLVTIGAWPIRKLLQQWDYATAQYPDIMLANAHFTASKIKKYYGREAAVIYPPVDLKIFHYDPNIQRGNYFLAVGRLIPWKRFDLIIEAFNTLALPLVIVGSEREDARRLKLNAGKTIIFIPEQNDMQLARLYQGAQALIFPQVEDFGLVAAESIACGTPVVAYSVGGALEIVQHGINGILFYEQRAETMIVAVREVMEKKWDHHMISHTAQRFSKENFQKRILEEVHQLQVE